MEKLKLRRHETFSLREGWIQKGIAAILENGNDTFHKEKGIKILGVGSNMVKALKYWIIAGNVAVLNKTNIELSDFGKVLEDYDKYLESDFSWCFYHYFLNTNFIESPVFYYITNIYKRKSFEKEDIVNEIEKYLQLKGYEGNRDLIAEDVNMYIRMYEKQEIKDPEDNLVSPIAGFGMLEKGYSSFDYVKTSINPERLNYRVVYYALQEIYKESFEVSMAFTDEKSPVKVFNLDKGVFSQYLNVMKNHGMITINKTAGLNTVYFNKRYSIEDLFSDYFGGQNV